MLVGKKLQGARETLGMPVSLYQALVKQSQGKSHGKEVIILYDSGIGIG